jgi:hypothetical protein
MIVIGMAAFYLNDYSHAEKTATDYLNGTAKVNVSKIDNYLFVDGYGNDTALIFYPGAKIEYTSYLPMFADLASKGVDCYLVEMPFNLAFLGEDSAEAIIDDGNYSHYILSGHSLGGVMVSSYMAHSKKGDGLILLSSYPTEKIDKPVLSMYGSEDKVLNMETYGESKTLMGNLTEVVIEGGNHAQFGYYGNQSGDGVGKITAKDQQKQTAREMLDFINAI